MRVRLLHGSEPDAEHVHSEDPLRRATTVLLATLLLVLTACGGASTTGAIEWRDLELVLPAGWATFEQRVDLLAASDDDLTETDDDTGEGTDATSIDPDENDVVALQFRHDTRDSADAWRALVTGAGGTIEQDVRIDIGGLPATSITFAWVTNNVPTRERVVIVPSRSVVMLFQPLPVQGQRTGPQVFLEKADQFEAILDSIRWGAPVDA